MEENVLMNTENQKPVGSLFDTINYYSVENLEEFISTLNQDQALYCIIEAVQSAYRRNAFTMAESEVVSKSIRKLSIPKINIKNATTEEDN
jgi:Zn-dependent oligopeptidase